MVLALVEYGVVVSSTAYAPPPQRLLPFYGALALLWTALTPVIAWWERPRHGALWLPARVAVVLSGIAAAGVLDSAVRRLVLVAEGMPPWTPFWATWLYFIDVTAAQYCAVVLAARVLEAHDAVVARTRAELVLRAQLARTRLTYLEAQLQPHFLFNALGAVSELAYEAPAAAARMLRQLAALLRTATERHGEEVTVAEELATLEPYLEIQRIRFADWLKIEQMVSPEARGVLVPRLVLQPLVENAIKHGLVGRVSRGRIEILARVEDRLLHVAVRDNGVGLGAAGHTPGHGIGLRNVRDRLSALYGTAWRLSLDALPSGGTSVALTIPARRAPREEDAPPTDVATSRAAGGRIPDLIRRHPAAATVLGWFLWGSAWVGQSRAYLVLRGRLEEAAMPRVLVTHFAGAAIWAAATPLVVWLARRFPVEGRTAPWRALAHLALATLLALAHALAWRTLLDALLPGEVPPWPEAYVTAIFVSVLAYFILLAVGHYGSAMQWLRERENTAASLRAELEESALRAATTRAQPEVLVQTLERLAGEVTDDVEGTERAIAALADDLREALDAGVSRQALAAAAAVTGEHSIA
jgi:two-component system sensor histidine kinase AlgZ